LRIYIYLQGSAFFSNASNKVNTNPAIHPTMFPSSSSIAIIGAGSVGSAIAQSLLLRRVVANLILVDIDNELCQAQVQDLCDTTHLHNVRIRQGSPVDAGRADIIIITAGAKQRPTDTRLDLIDRNLKVLGSVLGAMGKIRPDAILVLIANPVDVLTYFAQKLSGLPRNQVLGSGTLLDSIRLRGMLAEKLEVSYSIRTQIVNSATT
jgi:L-lactate dehydrogenase